MERTSPTSLGWRAVVGGCDAGSLSAWIRPDGRCSFSVRGEEWSVRAALVEALASTVPCELLTNVRGENDRSLRRYRTLGFGANRRETAYVLPVGSALLALDGMRAPAGIRLGPITGVDEARLRELDDMLRDDTPGTDGWQWSVEDFRDETYGPNVDAALYLVAEDDISGAYVGIVRIWVHEGRRPRLGFVGVLRQERRRGIARALLVAVFQVLADRGVDAVTAEVDVENEGSSALMISMGATPSGGYAELALPPRA